MARWLLGCVNVLAARKHIAARASDKRHAVEPMARKRLYRYRYDMLATSKFTVSYSDIR